MKEEKENNKKVLGYVRVSSHEQNEDRQVKIGRASCRERVSKSV